MPQQNRFHLLPVFSVSIAIITMGAAFGVLSGRGAFLGMVSACLISIITAIVGGSKYGISSPTGPMTAAMAVILATDQRWIHAHQAAKISPDALANLTLLVAGVLLMLLAALRIYKLIKWIPHLVVSGFVNGIALLIIVSQLRSLKSWNDGIVMAITFLAALAISKISQKYDHLAWRALGGSFAVIALMSLVCGALNLPLSRLDLDSAFSSIQWSLPSLGQMDLSFLWIILPLAAELAVIALLDTLLTAVIMDRKSRTRTHLGQELAGQSLSLAAVGLIGGIPGAQSTVPSVMLYQEGGHHRWSKIAIAAACVLLTVIFADLITFVPLAVFGGVILKVAVDVADFTSLKTAIKTSEKKSWLRIGLLLGTILSTVFLSLNLAVIAFTLVFVLWNKLTPKKWHIPDLRPEKESEGFSDEL